MPVYTIQTPCAFNIEADSEGEARNKLTASLLKQSEDVPYGDEWVYVPYAPSEPDFCIVVNVDEED